MTNAILIGALVEYQRVNDAILGPGNLFIPQGRVGYRHVFGHGFGLEFLADVGRVIAIAPDVIGDGMDYGGTLAFLSSASSFVGSRPLLTRRPRSPARVSNPGEGWNNEVETVASSVRALAPTCHARLVDPLFRKAHDRTSSSVSVDPSGRGLRVGDGARGGAHDGPPDRDGRARGGDVAGLARRRADAAATGGDATVLDVRPPHGVDGSSRSLPIPLTLGCGCSRPANADVWDRALLPLREAGPSWATLSLDPGATRVQVARGIGYLLAFRGGGPHRESPRRGRVPRGDRCVATGPRARGRGVAAPGLRRGQGVRDLPAAARPRRAPRRADP
jgi:hypothetical protein